MSWRFRTACGVVFLGLLFQPVGAAELQSEKAAACTKAAIAGKKGKAVFSGSAYFIVATQIEKQGKGNIRPAFEEPKSVCRAGTFQSGGFQVTAAYGGFEPGMQTLLYRFSADKGQDQREILVLYNGILSLVQESGPHFYVAETRTGRTSIYAMYDNEPAYDAVKRVVEGILSGSAKALIAVEWPEDSDELVIVEFDSTRLK